MSNNHYSIRKIEESDIANVVSIHCAAFKHFFLTQLGTSFLTIYYDTFNRNKKGVMFGCFENENLIGFCAATEKSAGFNKHLILDNFITFAIQGLKLLFTNIKALIRLYYNSKKTNSEMRDDGQYAELFSIAVSPLKQNSGIGKLLLDKLESELKARKCNEVALTTDYENNEKTLKFYNNMGYKVLYEFKAYPDRKMYRLIKKI